MVYIENGSLSRQKILYLYIILFALQIKLKIRVWVTLDHVGL